MSSSRFASLLYLLTFAFLLPAAFGVNPIFHFCSNAGNFSAYDPYEGNLKQAHLLPLISSSSLRGDVSTPDCQTCVVEAGNEIRKLCPSTKGAIIWYDNCLLKYSDTEFFGQIDNKNMFYLWNGRVVSDPQSFNQKTKELLSQLANEAYATPKLYATRETELYGSPKLYGLTQCTRDLSSSDCKKCLDGIIGKLPSCCDGQEGGRVVGGSCNFRYEIYPFVKA
ncbi:Receptor-like protein kinase-related family protein, putative [Theobroma cacao]|uniref:Receptor-like protein kinase-related family protein, putative n=1 Tax=Theobroma cacao TaxID=3641 RepID=A0A061FWU8_THECC|nr:Receptor-like protein kinase-related family protein, putative [Theobroma cacao]